LRAAVESLAAPTALLWFSQGAVIGSLDEVPVPSRDEAVQLDGVLPPFMASACWQRPVPLEVGVNFSSVRLVATDQKESVDVEVGGEQRGVEGRVWQSDDGASKVIVSNDDAAPGILHMSMDGGGLELWLLSTRAD
jgi:hypothetical protein